MSKEAVTRKMVEKFVRKVLFEDLKHNKVTDTEVRSVATKVSKAITVPLRDRKAA